MRGKVYPAPCGKIHYWVNSDGGPAAITLILLPGLTTGCLANRLNILRGNTTCWYGLPPGHGGSRIRYNKARHKSTGIPPVWIPGAGHNANTDAPDEVNGLIGKFVEGL